MPFFFFLPRFENIYPLLSRFYASTTLHAKTILTEIFIIDGNLAHYSARGSPESSPLGGEITVHYADSSSCSCSSQETDKKPKLPLIATVCTIVEVKSRFENINQIITCSRNVVIGSGTACTPLLKKQFARTIGFLVRRSDGLNTNGIVAFQMLCHFFVLRCTSAGGLPTPTDVAKNFSSITPLQNGTLGACSGEFHSQLNIIPTVSFE